MNLDEFLLVGIIVAVSLVAVGRFVFDNICDRKRAKDNARIITAELKAIRMDHILDAKRRRRRGDAR